MSHVSKLTNGLLPYPPLLLVSPRLQCATFLSSPTRSSLFLPSSESSLAMFHISELTNPLLPLSPLHQVSPHLCCAIFRTSPTHFSLLLPSLYSVLILYIPHLHAHQQAPPPSYPPA